MTNDISACGRKVVRVDSFDLDINGGAICCNECASILASRNSWMVAFAAVPSQFSNAGQYVEVPF